MRVERFDSVESYTKQCLAKKQEWQKTHSPWQDHMRIFSGNDFQGYRWTLGIKYDESIKLGIQGDPSIVAKCESQVDNLVNTFSFRQENLPRYRPSVAGSRVSVPDYLAGSPLSMRKKMMSETQNRSVNIYVGTTSWAVISAENLLKRGQTILALLEFLQLSQVSINLYLVSELDGVTDGDFIQVIKVQSQPLDLSTAAFAIAHPAFDRNVCHGMAFVMDGYAGGFPYSFQAYDLPTYQEKLAKAIGMEENDIYVPFAGPGDRTIWESPEKWISEQIMQFLGQHK